MTSIDDATPEEWDALAKKFNGYKTDGQEAREARRRETQIEKVNGKLDAYNNVNHPSHYNQGRIEVIDAIEDWDLNFCEGNVVKYVARHRFKGERLEDLKKARWYLERLILTLES